MENCKEHMHFYFRAERVKFFANCYRLSTFVFHKIYFACCVLQVLLINIQSHYYPIL